MRVRGLICEEKEIVTDTGWKTTRLQPKYAPIIRGPQPMRSGWKWRSSSAKGLVRGNQYILLVKGNPARDNWQSILMQKFGEEAAVIARYEYHGSHPGIHGHAHCERGGIERGGIGMGELVRIPKSGGHSYHRRTQALTENAFWESAKKIFSRSRQEGVAAMISEETIAEQLCNAFCSSIFVNKVPCGFAVCTMFMDTYGDPIEFYVVKSGDGFRFEDSGEYLSRLIAMGIPIDKGQRSEVLDSILRQGGAFLNRKTYEIQSESFGENQLSEKITGFLSALIRVRDLELFTQEVVRSTFRDDAISALKNLYGESAKFVENKPVDASFIDYTVDLIIHPNAKSAVIGAVYFVTTSEKLHEALLLQMASKIRNCLEFETIALVERSKLKIIGKKNLQRAQNESLFTQILSENKVSEVQAVGEILKLAA